MGSVAEEWRIVPGFENYDVSNAGRVRNNKTRRILKGIAHRGYLVVKLGRPNRAYGIHQVVAWAFKGPCQPGMVVNHRNGIKTDNRPDNLEYTTNEGNVRHAYRTNLISNVGELNGKARLSEQDVRRIRTEGLTTKQIREQFGVGRHVAYQIRHKKTWKTVV